MNLTEEEIMNLTDEEIKTYAAVFILMYGNIEAYPDDHEDAVEAWLSFPDRVIVVRRSGKAFLTYRAAYLAKWICDHA